MSYTILLFLHIAAVIIWVGGMAIMHFAVRPSAVEMLEPPQCLPFMAATLGRFFVAVSISIITLLISGAGMLYLMTGLSRVPPSVHAMVGLGLIMMAIFGHIRFAAFPRLRRAVATAAWPDAARQLTVIRHAVAINLALGFLTVAVAILGRSA